MCTGIRALIWSTAVWTAKVGAKKVTRTPLSATSKTTFSSEGFPLYRRRKEEDLLVVPYNREIFLDWGCSNINCDFSGQTYTILYLYKYLFKGATKVTVTFGQGGGGPPPLLTSARNPVKSSQVLGLRDRVAIIRALLHAISSPHPYAGYGDLNGVGRRRNLSEAACYRNWPRSR